MSVVVDTPIWSEFFRRQRPDKLVSEKLQEAIEAGEAVLLGPIRQEILSGIRDPKQFTKLGSALRAFPDLPLETADYERAASYFNQCRASGIQGSNSDFLICAVAHRLSAEILTLDNDFDLFAAILPIQLTRFASGT